MDEMLRDRLGATEDEREVYPYDSPKIEAVIKNRVCSPELWL